MSEVNNKEIDKAVSNLFSFSEKILNYKNPILNVNPVVTKLKKLLKVIELMEADEKTDLFHSQIYLENKADILNYSDEKNFLAKGKINLSIGKDGNRVLMLSSVYNKTLKLKSDTEKMLDSLPETARDKAIETAEELNFPDIITLYVYRVLKLSAENKADKDKLIKIVNEIESDLGIKSTDTPTANNGININTAGINQANAGNMMSGLMAGLGPMIQNLQGQFSGANGKQPDFASIMSGLVNSNPTIKGVVTSAFPKFEDCKSPGDLLSQVSDKLGDPNLKNMVEGFSQKIPELMASMSPPAVLPTATETLAITGGDSTVAPSTQD